MTDESAPNLRHRLGGFLGRHFTKAAINGAAVGTATWGLNVLLGNPSAGSFGAGMGVGTLIGVYASEVLKQQWAEAQANPERPSFLRIARDKAGLGISMSLGLVTGSYFLHDQPDLQRSAMIGAAALVVNNLMLPGIVYLSQRSAYKKQQDLSGPK